MRLFALFPLFLFTANIDASVQSTEALTRLAEEFTLSSYESATKVEVTVKPLDKRLKLAECSDALVPFWPYGSAREGNTVVGIRCEGEASWKIQLRVNIRLFDYIAVLNTPVQRGDSVSTGILDMELVDITTIRHDGVLDPASVEGFHFRRRFSAGRPLTRAMLEKPMLVNRGEQVRLVRKKGSLSVNGKGVALQDGSENAMIEVRNLSSGRVIFGQAIAKGVVRIN